MERRAKVLRGRVREAMETKGVDSFVSAGGHTASLFSTTRWMADRKKALSQFSAEIVNAIFRPQTSTTLRVK